MKIGTHGMGNKEFYIRDPVSNDIHIGFPEREIIEKPEFQRLRRIKQLGFAYLVFPGAHHTRFEHSLGTFKITKEISEGIEKHENEELAIAGMLHDIGHMPFSHESETPLYKYSKLMHEDVGKRMLKESGILDDVGKYALSKKKILSYFDGISEGKIVTGPIGSDRIDYLLRDSYYTGVAYGMIDYYRIKNILALWDGKPAVYSDGIDAVESFFIARYYMYSSIYFHHTVITANAMYRKALKNALRSGEIDHKEFEGMDDEEAIAALSNSKGSVLIKRVIERKLFKRAYYQPNYTGDITQEELDEIAQKAGLEDDEYVAEVHRFRGMGDRVEVLSKSGEKVGELSGMSDIFKILVQVLEKRKVVLVACDPDKREKLSTAIEKAL